MGTRVIDPKLQELYDKNIPVYSISKLDTINNCLYGAYKTYIEGDRGSGNIYSYLGTRIHDTLEDIMNDRATESDLLPAMTEELEDMEMTGIEFPKDRSGEDTLKKNWIADMEHFCKTYKKPSRGKFKTEEFFLYRTSKGYYVQGYIDLIRVENEKSISIYDYKTSSLYSGENIKEHGRQLITYALAKIQQGLDVKSVSWIFLKYAEVRFMGYKTAKSKEKTEITKVVERRKIASELAKYIDNDLTEIGLDIFDIETYLDDFKRTNDLKVLPDEIAANYKIRPYVLEYELTDEVIQETENYINNTVEKWERLSGKIEDYPCRCFTKTLKNGNTTPDVFFCQTLCSHKMCNFVTDFLNTLQKEGEDDDLFG